MQVNFNSLATDNVNCIVGVCDEGKIYYLEMAVANGASPFWRKADVFGQKDYRAVAGASGCFMAVNADQWFVGNWNSPTDFKWYRMGTFGAAATAGEFVGLVHVSGDVFMAVTGKGKLFRIKGMQIHEVVDVPLSGMAAKFGVIGLSRLSDTEFIIYGYPGADDANMFRVKFGGTDIDSAIDPVANGYSGTIYKIKQGGKFVEINDLAFLNDQKWYVAGQNGIMGYGTGTLASSGPTFEYTTTSTIQGDIPNHVTAVGVGSRAGFHEAFAGTEGGRIFYTKLQDSGVREMREGFPGMCTENFNDLVFMEVADSDSDYRAFLGGNNGMGVYAKSHGVELRGHHFSSEQKEVFRWYVKKLCFVSPQRVFAGGTNGFFYRGDKGDDGSFNWHKCDFQALGSAELGQMAKCADTLYALWGTDGDDFSIAKFNLEGEFQAATRDNITAGTTNTVAIDSGAGKRLFIGTTKGVYLYADGNPDINKLTITGVENFDAYWVAGKDRDKLYVVGTKNFGGDSVLFSITDQGGSWAGSVIKELPGVFTGGMTILDGKVYICGLKVATNKGYLAEYDGNAFSELSAGPTGIALGDPWGYGDYLYICGYGKDGYTYNYNIKTKVWTSESVTSNALQCLGGSGEGGILMTGGKDGRVFRTKISTDSGEETSTEVLPATGEDADLIASNNPVKRSSSELKQQFNTAPGFEPLGNVEDFTTKTTLAAGSVHCFKFNVTPDVTVGVNDCHLYKLISSSSSSTDYTRLNEIPVQADYAHGTYWLTDPDGVVKVSGEQLQAGTIYTVFFVIEDNGNVYDADPTLGTIADPTVFGYSGSGGGGCVLDPNQEDCMDLTWMLFGMAVITLLLREMFLS
ncbi:hypothetical protein [Desulfovibrio sp. JC022]|uniref:hypothetical protein n=1 Tax=Desulfovibrio sp. JC022 TaxID=2593642 RepID=UPI0013D1BE12|nr:hypothetical protein [Desulfovibrio sp. JC022]NDV22254.1 hypothetical protein [Desulfovibrio sp. JC022]